MLLKATFPSSYLGLVEATPASKKKWLSIRTARYIFMSVKNMPSSQHYIIYSPPFRWTTPLYSLPQRCEQQQPKTGCVDRVFGKPPLITDASTTICTRFNSRAAVFPTPYPAVGDTGGLNDSGADDDARQNDNNRAGSVHGCTQSARLHAVFPTPFPAVGGTGGLNGSGADGRA